MIAFAAQDTHPLFFPLQARAQACASIGAAVLTVVAGAVAAYFALTAPNSHSAAIETGYVVAHAAAPASAPTPAATPPAASAHAAAAGPDLDCLAAAVYYEARGEALAGQAAVAQVVLNRFRHPAYPKSICAVVFQGQAHRSCQFSFVCNGAMRRPREPVAWSRAREVAARALEGYTMRQVGAATGFHARSVGGSGGLRVAEIGQHIFYVATRAIPLTTTPERRSSGRRSAADAQLIRAVDHLTVTGAALSTLSEARAPSAAPTPSEAATAPSAVDAAT